MKKNKKESDVSNRISGASSRIYLSAAQPRKGGKITENLKI